jgi:hypothetical protein
MSQGARLRVIAIAAGLRLFADSTPLSAQSLLDEKLAEPVFATFYHGIRRCVMSTRPHCLTEFLDPTFSFSPWWGDGDRQIPRSDFVTFAWRSTPKGSTESLWQTIAWVFLRGQLREIDGGVRFVRGNIECRVYETRDTYLITHCDSRE